MKTSAWLLAISFIPFSVFGFLFARLSSFGPGVLDPPVPQIGPATPTSQVNILFISIDLSAKPNPRLVSIWGLFFAVGDYPSSQMIQLFPSDNSLKDAVLLSEFSLDKNGHLQGDFLDITEKAFQLTWDYYSVVDQKGISHLMSQLHATPGNKDQEVTLQTNESALLNSLCSVLLSPEADIDLAQLLHAYIIDNNFSVAVIDSFQNWMDSKQILTSCEVQE